MKYMGSKRLMIENGLGALVKHRSRYSKRVFDLFCGASSVSWYAAQHTRLPVYSSDLQSFSVVLARSVVERTEPINPDDLISSWLGPAVQQSCLSEYWKEAASLRLLSDNEIDILVQEARSLCAQPLSVGPVWNAYGGYYFGPVQALLFDYTLSLLPVAEPQRSVCLASIISSASRCAASPGHTAQPFKANRTAGPYLREAWAKDPIAYAKEALLSICPIFANAQGEARVADAIELSSKLRRGDLAFVDPPYSNVQYSRFYHVLETIVVGQCSDVSGSGRYPPIAERPQSDFSKVGKSQTALLSLLDALADAEATVIFTFPAGMASNGLSGGLVKQLSAERFHRVDEIVVDGEFSTLGGNNKKRASRKPSRESILLMRPK